LRSRLSFQGLGREGAGEQRSSIDGGIRHTESTRLGYTAT
jgi:hypothetical protein